MRLPLIICEQGDLDLFESIESACNYLEPIDIRNDEYIGYDASGQLLKLEIKCIDKSFLGIKTKLEKVIITETKIYCEKELIEKILMFFKRSEKDEKSRDLNRLLSQLTTKIGYTK